MSDEHAGSDELLSLARRIADGEPVDWSEEAASSPESDAPLLRALSDIAAIGAAHRDAQEAFEAEFVDRPPSRWQHLTILETIGSGRFGCVSRAFDPTLQIEVALKLSALHPSESFDASVALREARQLAKITHPNVVRVHGADHADGRVGIWMDLVHGRTLETIAKQQRFGAAEAVNVGIQMCRALAAVHREGVLHGDLKPHNIIRRDDGEYVLVDFGASRPLDQTPDAGDLVGTLVYMAPEVLDGGARSRASDIYSLGIVLFRLVTDAYPVFADSVPAALALHRSGHRKRLRDLRADLPAYFVEAVERAVHPDPAVRWTSAAALESALLNIEPPPPPPVQPVRWPSVALGVLVVAMASGGWLWTRGRATDDVSVSTPVPATGESFTIDASFRRVTPAGPEPLSAGQPIRVNDEFFLSLNVSRPTHLYVVDEDERGKAFLLFPLPGDAQANPIRAGLDTRIPAADNWTVDAAGGSEHLVVFASPDPLAAFEDAFKRLPSPSVGGQSHLPRPVTGSIAERLRSAGRLTPNAETGTQEALPTFRQFFQTPLTGPETATGLWVRQLTLASLPAK